jgi:hypothetical protein
MLRDRDEEIAWLRAALKRKKAFEAGEPVPANVRARKAKPRW